MSERKRSGRVLKAAAIGYLRGVHAAPKVIAKGGGDVAKTILARAEEHGIPVERDPDLLECLAPLEVGDDIPVEAYRAVATILSFLYKQNREPS